MQRDRVLPRPRTQMFTVWKYRFLYTIFAAYERYNNNRPWLRETKLPIPGDKVERLNDDASTLSESTDRGANTMNN